MEKIVALSSDNNLYVSIDGEYQYTTDDSIDEALKDYFAELKRNCGVR